MEDHTCSSMVFSRTPMEEDMSLEHISLLPRTVLTSLEDFRQLVEQVKFCRIFRQFFHSTTFTKPQSFLLSSR
ncbi:unnamed protein product, partial [Linum tenue]